MKFLLAATVLFWGLGGCGGSSSTPVNAAGGRCNLNDSPNTCLRCWAQKCTTQLDYCFGAGFHAGELIGANTTSSSAPCAAFSNCVQICGCFDSCFETCSKEIKGSCTECQMKYFAACRAQSCAAECSAGDGGS
jgi:hypothetical protein